MTELHKTNLRFYNVVHELRHYQCKNTDALENVELSLINENTAKLQFPNKYTTVKITKAVDWRGFNMKTQQPITHWLKLTLHVMVQFPNHIHQKYKFLTFYILQSQNTLFIETSFKDPLLSVSLSCPLVPIIPNVPWFSSAEILALYKPLTYLQIAKHIKQHTSAMASQHKFTKDSNSLLISFCS